MLVRRSLNFLYLASGALAALCLVAIGLLVLASVVTRPLGIYIPGLNAYAGYAMAASSFLALAYAFRRGSHIRVGLVLSKLRGTARRIGEIWCLALAAGFSCYLAFYLYKLVSVSRMLGDVSEAADATPLWIPQVALAVGSGIFALSILDRLVCVLFGWENVDADDGDAEAGLS